MRIYILTKVQNLTPYSSNHIRQFSKKFNGFWILNPVFTVSNSFLYTWLNQYLNEKVEINRKKAQKLFFKIFYTLKCFVKNKP